MATTLTIDQFDTITNFIYRKTGIRFESKKMYFISKRLNMRMQNLGMDNTLDYIHLLLYNDRFDTEFHNLIDLLTINETYFFRDFNQLQTFAEQCLDEVCKRKAAAGDYKLRLWSAACSSGEEPYTLAIILQEMLDNYRHWEIEIIASDIDRKILNKARKAEYNDRSVREVPPGYFKKYFENITVDGKSCYRLRNTITRMVKFEQVNLSSRDAIRDHLNFDFIFCRNLLIYFDDVSRKNLVDQFYIALNPGGYVFLGSSESVSRISTVFKVKRMNNYLVYYK